MTIYSKQSYDDQDDGRILKVSIMFPAPIAFINDELKAEPGMKANKDEKEEEMKFCSLNVPMYHEDKDPNTYMVKINKCDTGTPEELLIRRLTLNEQIKNHGYSGHYEMVINLTQAMLAVRGL
jgi:hypothetical protein